MNRLTFHGHAAFELETSKGTRIMFDPWLDQNPLADIKVADVKTLDYIMVSHGHGDHFSDVVELAIKTKATVIATFELAALCQSKGVKNAHGMSIGGGYRFPFGYVKLTPALHGTGIDGGENGNFSTMPNGFWVDLGDARVYHSGDTALLMDMHLLAGRVDVAMLPIGDNFTMGPEDAVRAVEFIEPRVVIPMHYNTFDLIKQDPQDFARRVGDRAQVKILKPGESFEF
jgi:L-ascorbate metabolism protein UlaG (beta-lactamase superfamily)